ncbi:hypothetical protein I5M27_09370 [Adhaeribacter sp. BT258]|uniref:Uncharacterized protein n=1 Tax=Adhaeribacter terrigena TaxID=2793070 RepID=A0ABS1C1C3_9BACT|nr:hypothetical protein [Adhaeribacter terrigena]MBK0403194.1 hypothetical protein [Adhaeribacter terrigena]
MSFKFQLFTLAFMLFCSLTALGQKLKFSYHLNDKGEALNITDCLNQKHFYPQQLFAHFSNHGKPFLEPLKLNNDIYAQNNIQKVIKEFSNEVSRAQVITEVYGVDGFIRKIYIQNLSGEDKRIDSVSFVYTQNHSVVLRIGTRKEFPTSNKLPDTIAYYLNPKHQITKVVFNHPCYLSFLTQKKNQLNFNCRFEALEFKFDDKDRIIEFVKSYPDGYLDSGGGKMAIKINKEPRIRYEYIDYPRRTEVNSFFSSPGKGFRIAEIFKDVYNRPDSIRYSSHYDKNYSYKNTEKIFYTDQTSMILKRKISNSFKAVGGYDQDSLPTTYYPEYSELIYNNNGLLSHAFTVRDYRDPLVLKAVFYKDFDMEFAGKNKMKEVNKARKAVKQLKKSLEMAKKNNELEKYYKRFPVLTITYIQRED